MIEGLEPYAAYRPFPGPWIPRVPTHWSVVRTKSVVRERVEKGHPDEPLLAATQSMGVVRKDRYGSRTVTAQKDLHLLKFVRVGDFVISLRSFQGGIEYARDQGIISPAYTILRATPEATHAYLALLFKSRPFVESLTLHVTGIREGQNVDYPRLARAELPLPPPHEQAAIVRFLDHADRRIRRYVRAKQKLIKLLEEQKQAIIHQAVTRGLDPSVPTKDSALPWVPRVPAHWDLVPNRAHLKVRKVLVRARHGEFELLSLTKRGVIVRDISENKGKFSSDLGTSQEVRPGDLVFCLFDVPETPRTVGLSSHVGMITGAYTVFECVDPAVARFLEAFYIAMDDRKLLSPLYSGLRHTIPKERLLGARTPLPPPEERERILDAITSASAAHERAIDGARREVALLGELRTRLISDVVTGQLDVRAAAAGLPDESEEAELVDDDEVADNDAKTTDDPGEEPDE